MRFFLTLAYKGTAYSGWQIQDNAPSVQAALQGALSVLLGEPTEVVGAGRTDAGVHAAYYVAHFDTVSEKPLDEDSFIYHLNAILPRDIAAFGVKRVTDEAHARFSATRREYKYYLTLEKDPFRTETAYRYPLALDMDRMNQSAEILMEYTDFESFCKADGNNKTTLCRIFASGWTRQGNLLIYTIAADRFLRNMVRAIVGTLIDVGRGKLSVDDFRAIIEAKSRCAAGTSAPAHGLFLTDVHYPEHLLR
jgi:tRNA pseudouridine38-40 synthase